MKSYILKRLKDGQFVSVGEKELQSTLARQIYDGVTLKPEFELVAEEKNVEEEMEKLFG